MFSTSLCIFRTDGKIAHKDSDKNKKAYVFPDLSMDFDYDVMPTQHLLIWGVKPPHKKLEQAVDWVLPSLQIPIDKMDSL